MPVPSHVLRFWRALDDLVGDVEPTAWGAVVTDPCFPSIWDANYARVDVPDRSLTAGRVEGVLVPALERAGAGTEHIVSFHPEDTTGLLSELSSRGHVLSWDVVMEQDGGPSGRCEVPIEELTVDAAHWDRVEQTIALFGVEPPASHQLLMLEEGLSATGAKRWFGVRDEAGVVVSLAAVALLEGVGYIDNVATFPHARGRGYASALTARAAREARDVGASHVVLLADPDASHALRMYGRLGFVEVGRLASTKGPLPDRG